jgi:hypothetical protein
MKKTRSKKSHDTVPLIDQNKVIKFCIIALLGVTAEAEGRRELALICVLPTLAERKGGGGHDFYSEESIEKRHLLLVGRRGCTAAS